MSLGSVFLRWRGPGVDCPGTEIIGSNGMCDPRGNGDDVAGPSPYLAVVEEKDQLAFQDEGDLLTVVRMAFEQATGIDFEVGQHDLIQSDGPPSRARDVVSQSELLTGIVVLALCHRVALHCADSTPFSAA
jgi:hypothetical protein